MEAPPRLQEADPALRGLAGPLVRGVRAPGCLGLLVRRILESSLFPHNARCIFYDCFLPSVLLVNLFLLLTAV